MRQGSSVGNIEKKITTADRFKSRVPVKVPLADVNEYLLCQTCFGYLIDATAIIECQHTFCKACIIKNLETNGSYCPVCDVQLNEGKPHLSLRSDENLQKLVYKLVPGLLATELKRRKEFGTKISSEESLTTLDGILLASDIKEAEDFCFLSHDDRVSLSLEYFKSSSVDEDGKSEQASKSATPAASSNTATTTIAAETSAQKKNTCSEKANDRRYLSCPAAVSVGLLKKFIRMKYGLSDDYRVDLLYNGDRDNNLENDLTLFDLSFIFKWKKAEPMCFHYRIFDRPVVKSVSVRSGTKRSAPSMMDEPPDDDAASGPTSRSSMMSAAPSKLPRLGDSGTSSSNTTSGSTPKNNTGKGQGKKSNVDEKPVENVELVTTAIATAIVIPERFRGQRNSNSSKEIQVSSSKSLEGLTKMENKNNKSTSNHSLNIKSSIDHPSGSTNSLNLKITTTTSPLGSMTSKISPSSSSCSSTSSPPSPLKISLPLKAISEGKSHHHHRHHHRHHKEKKRHRSSKSKDKDKEKDREKDREKGKDKDKVRYKYNAHPNPSQSQTISVKPGKHHGKSAATATTATASAHLAGGIGRMESGKKDTKEKEKTKGNGNNCVDVASSTNLNKIIPVLTNGGKNCNPIIGHSQRLSTSSPGLITTITNPKTNNSISVSKIIERRNSTTSNILSSINANSGIKSELSVMSERKSGTSRSSLASKIAAAAAEQNAARALIPESVHLQVPKSVTLIPVNPPNSGNGGGKSANRSFPEKVSGNPSRLSSNIPIGTPHTFTHPITNKSLHQITVTEVPPPPKYGNAEANSNCPPVRNSGGYNGTGTGSSNTTSSIKSIEKNIQSLSSKQFNGPGSMEITKIYCDNKSSTSSNCSSKVFETQGKKLKGLDISISTPTPHANCTSGNVKPEIGLRKIVDDRVQTKKLSVSVSKSIPKIPGVSILPQTNHLVGKQQQAQQQQKTNFNSGQPDLMSMSSKMNEKHSNRLSISPASQQGGKNQLSLPLQGENFQSPATSAFLRAKSPADSLNGNKTARRTPPRKQMQIGDALTTTLVVRTPSPPHHQQKSNFLSSADQKSKGKIKRPFESTFPQNRGNVSPDSGVSERKRNKKSGGSSNAAGVTGIAKSLPLEHDSPLDLSGKSSRSTPSPAEHLKGDNSFSPTSSTSSSSSSSSSEPNHSKGKGHATSSGHKHQGQRHNNNMTKVQQQQSNKSASTIAIAQTRFPITSQNFTQKQLQQNSEIQRLHQRQQHRLLMRSKSMNGSTAGNTSGSMSPPINQIGQSTGSPTPTLFDQLKLLSDTAARVPIMNNSMSILEAAAASVTGFCPTTVQSSLTATLPISSPVNHPLSPHFSAHHHMNMNLMSPPQLKPSVENSNSFFPNFSVGNISTNRVAGVGGSLSPPLQSLSNPFLSTAASRASASLRIPNVSSKLNSKNPINPSTPAAFPSISLSSNSGIGIGKSNINISSRGSGTGSGTLSKVLSPASQSSTLGLSLTRPTKINGNLVPSTPNTFVAPSSIIPISKAQSQSVKNAIPNSMKISNFLPSTKSTSISANTNATITSSSSLSKYLNSLPPSTLTSTPSIEIPVRTFPKFSIESIASIQASKAAKSLNTNIGIGNTSTTSSIAASVMATCSKPIIPIKTVTSTMSTTLNDTSSIKSSASTGYKLSSTSSTSSTSSEAATSLGGKNNVSVGSSGTNSGSEIRTCKLGDLGIALGLVPREPPAYTTQQQNQAVRHIPNPSQIFFRQNPNYTVHVNSNNKNTLATPTTAMAKSITDTATKAKPESELVDSEKKLTSSSDSLEVIKPAKPEPLVLPSLPLSSEPPMAIMKKTEQVVSHEANMKCTKKSSSPLPPSIPPMGKEQEKEKVLVFKPKNEIELQPELNGNENENELQSITERYYTEKIECKDGKLKVNENETEIEMEDLTLTIPLTLGKSINENVQKEKEEVVEKKPALDSLGKILQNSKENEKLTEAEVVVEKKVGTVGIDINMGESVEMSQVSESEDLKKKNESESKTQTLQGEKRIKYEDENLVVDMDMDENLEEEEEDTTDDDDEGRGAQVQISVEDMVTQVKIEKNTDVNNTDFCKSSSPVLLEQKEFTETEQKVENHVDMDTCTEAIPVNLSLVPDRETNSLIVFEETQIPGVIENETCTTSNTPIPEILTSKITAIDEPLKILTIESHESKSQLARKEDIKQIEETAGTITIESKEKILEPVINAAAIEMEIQIKETVNVLPLIQIQAVETKPETLTSMEHEEIQNPEGKNPVSIPTLTKVVTSAATTIDNIPPVRTPSDSDPSNTNINTNTESSGNTRTNPSFLSSSTLSALIINTTARVEPPKSLLIPSPTLVSMTARSGGPSSPVVGLSPGSEKKVDLKKMENLEKVAAGLLASAANNINNNNNNMIVTSSTTTNCDLSLNSAPSNPANTARATPPPITNV